MKRICKPWSAKERNYIFERVTQDEVHPYDVWEEYKRHADFTPRTYNAIKALLKDNNMSYAGLIRKADGRAIEEKDQLTEEQMREELSKRGYKVEKREEAKTDRKVKIDTSIFAGDKYKLAVISCTHLGNKWQQLTHLKSFYQYIQDEGIQIVLHCGDFIDGINVYRGQEYEVFIHGAQAQQEYATAQYPRMENGGKTYVIGGNHDYSFIQKSGTDVLRSIAQERGDIEYLGSFGAYPQLKPLNIFMHHGGGGVAYADSYKLQKNIENFSPENKPDIYFFGHFHKWCHLSQYRNVIGWTIGSFEGQTPYAKRHNWQPQIGGLIVEFDVNDAVRKNGIAQFTWRTVPYYVLKENDY